MEWAPGCTSSPAGSVSYIRKPFRTLDVEESSQETIYCYICCRKGIPVTRRIIISKGNELLRVPYDCLMFVSSDGNYSNVVTVDGKSRLVSYQLGQIEDAINDQLGDDGMIFLRLGRSLIINTEFIHFIDVGRQQLILSDCKGSFHELTASKEVLAKLKAYVESLEKGNNGQTRR